MQNRKGSMKESWKESREKSIRKYREKPLEEFRDEFLEQYLMESLAEFSNGMVHFGVQWFNGSLNSIKDLFWNFSKTSSLSSFLIVYVILLTEEQSS